jgi:hypothetical protein
VNCFGWTALEERDRYDHSIGTGCVGVHWTGLSYRAASFVTALCGVVTSVWLCST